LTKIQQSFTDTHFGHKHSQCYHQQYQFHTEILTTLLTSSSKWQLLKRLQSIQKDHFTKLSRLSW